ncbi:MAG TPA: hypothetical protein VHE37_16800 [Nevskiaceae bacterium]|nr:hypothetical protein [Nevskiaceae bacterium]
MKRAVGLALFIAAGSAQADISCKEGETPVDQLPVAIATGIAGATLTASAPRSTPTETKSGAAAGSAASAHITDGADFPSLLAFAVENGFASENAGATTFNLNLFAIEAFLDPKALDDQYRYEQYQTLRRFGGSVSFGGKGQSFDRDGDGKPDAAETAANSSDIVSWEFTYRFYGSRDRRDPQNFERFFARSAQGNAQLDQLYAPTMLQTSKSLKAMGHDMHSSCVTAEERLKLASDAALVEKYRSVAAAADMVDSAANEILQEIDQGTLWTLYINGVSRKPQFGNDEYGAGIRGGWGGPDRGLTLNAGYRQVQDGPAGPLNRSAIGALQFSQLVMRKNALSKEGMKLSLSARLEKYWDHAPVHGTIAKLNAQLEIPVSDAVTIPLSVTWANHTDLVTGEKDVRGNIGISFNPSELFKPTKL